MAEVHHRASTEGTLGLLHLQLMFMELGQD
jgi:hypothetical protein